MGAEKIEDVAHHSTSMELVRPLEEEEIAQIAGKDARLSLANVHGAVPNWYG